MFYNSQPNTIWPITPDGRSSSIFIFIIFTFMDKTPSIHDNFIRSILSDKGIAIDYFKASLPAFIRERLDFSTLEQLPDRDKWEYRTLKDLFADIEPEWHKYVPNFDYIYHNLGEVPDEQLEVLNNNFLKASLLALKHSFESG